MEKPILDNLFDTCSEATIAINVILAAARRALRVRISHNGNINTKIFARGQFAAHGFVWLNTYVERLRAIRIAVAIGHDAK